MSAQHRLRLPAAFATSAALHAAALALVLRTAVSDPGPPVQPPVKLIAVSLVSRPGGGGGGPLPGPPSPPKGTPEPRPELPVVASAPPKPVPPVSPVPPTPDAQAAPVATPSSSAVAGLRALSPRPAPLRVAPQARRETPPARDVPSSAPPATVGAAPDAAAGGGGQVASLGAASGRGGGGAGTGDGTGGDGSDGLARPAHGSNPKPPYPLAARRLGVEGVVTLEVLVRPDGTPAEVHVRRSSGSALLDESALDTVRSRWRFVPARRGDVAVESRVTFPIRFMLDAS